MDATERSQQSWIMFRRGTERLSRVMYGTEGKQHIHIQAYSRRKEEEHTYIHYTAVVQQTNLRAEIELREKGSKYSGEQTGQRRAKERQRGTKGIRRWTLGRIC